MSDVDLRGLERAWRASGSDGARALWLRARVRSGDLDERRLKAAAMLGDGAARLARGDEATAFEVLGDRGRLLTAAALLGPEGWLRLALCGERRGGLGLAQTWALWRATEVRELSAGTWAGRLHRLVREVDRLALDPFGDEGGAWDLFQGLATEAGEDEGRPGWRGLLDRALLEVAPWLLGQGGVAVPQLAPDFFPEGGGSPGA